MAKSLVVVESPAKAKTIGKYLGKEFTVVASVGHIKDLPPRKLGVDIEHGFEPQYQLIRGKQDVVERIKKAAKGAEKVFLASDPDREGEAIAWHVMDEIKKSRSGKNKEFYRVMMHEITARGVKSAFEDLHTFDEPERQHLFYAQLARRILDRLVGYQISPLLWKKVKRGLSAGRVQSVAVRFVVDREREIRAFVPEEYWNISALLEGDKKPEFKAKLIKINGKKAAIHNEEEASNIEQEVKAAGFILRKIVRKTRKRNPVPPFITSRLQQEAARKLRFSARKTMTIAQKLYEGVDVGEEAPVGLITYMRTDSVRVSDIALDEVRQFISERFGEQYLPKKPNIYKNKKNIQDAHEAIRPTSVSRTPESVKKYLSRDEYRLYELIWKRFVASQMTPAVFDQTVFEIESGKYLFQAIGEIMKFAGFLSVYEEGKDDSSDDSDNDQATLPELSEGDSLKLLELIKKQSFTQPPPRYTEATLVRELEEKGIGRPSTYAAILSNIQDKGYVEKKQGRFEPTKLGELITDLLKVSFPEIMDAAFTAEMEEKLDKVEEGSLEWKALLEEFYQWFEKRLEEAKEGMKRVKGEEVEGIKCPVCGAPMVIRWGKRGSFLACSQYPTCTGSMDFEYGKDGEIIPIEPKPPEVVGKCPTCGADMHIKVGRSGEFAACSNYPECRTTASIKRNEDGSIELIFEKQEAASSDSDAEKQDMGTCPKCGSALVVRKGKYGAFLACSAYPKCDYRAPLPPQSTGVPCPKGCGGELLERRTRKRRVFYGCSNYPECDFATWKKPVAKECPNCHAPSMVEVYHNKKLFYRCELCETEIEAEEFSTEHANEQQQQ